MAENEDFWERDDVMSEEEYEFAMENGLNPEEYEEVEEEYEEEESPENFMDLYEEEYETMGEEEYEAKSAEVLDAALIRLEQGKLYKLIMEHIDSGMFSEVDCDQRSIDNVEREMRAFIMSRLETLLGIRKPKKKLYKKTVQKDDFTPIERKVLKTVVGKAMGNTTIKPVSEKKTSLKKIAPEQPRKVLKKQEPKPVVKEKPKPMPKPQTKKTAKKKTKKVVKQTKKRRKSPYKMTADELIERNKSITARSSAVSNTNDPNYIPPPTSQDAAMHYQSQILLDEQDPNSQSGQLMSLLKLVNKNGEQ